MRKGISLRTMKVKGKKSNKGQVPFDPILFAATVPSRQPTAKDRADAKERADDAVEPKDHVTMEDKYRIVAASLVTEADLPAARLGARFGRMDLASQLALLAVEALGLDFQAWPRDRIGICLAARAGSLAADLEFWSGRDAAGGPSPTLFAYTLPSAAIGEIAIRHRITGPNLCLVGGDTALREAADWLRRGEAEACLCLWSNVVTPALADLLQAPSAARAGAVFLQRGGPGRELQENDRDIEALCAVACSRTSANPV